MLKFLTNPTFVLLITLAVVIPYIAFDLFFARHQSPQVLSQSTTVVANSPTPSIVSSPTPTLQARPKPSKSTYSIALYGDSMVDTMGEDLPYLAEALAVSYPETKFNLYNYGIGAQNVAAGLERVNSAFSYQTRSYVPIAQINADIIIIGSFAYNPFVPHNRDLHWQTLTQLIMELKKTDADLYMLVEIAPIYSGFGVGPGGINWVDEIAKEQAVNIKQQLESALSLAKAVGLPLIDAYSPSQVAGGFGDKVYVSTHDGIHPSVEGHHLIAGVIVKTVKLL